MLGYLIFSNQNFRSQRLVPLTQAGDKLPDATVYEGTPKDAVKIRDVFKGKKGVLFGVPGILHPTPHPTLPVPMSQQMYQDADCAAHMVLYWATKRVNITHFELNLSLGQVHLRLAAPRLTCPATSITMTSSQRREPRSLHAPLSMTPS